MKKSILIGALAVMMLFAFTACEPQIAGVIPGGDSPVAKVTFVSANDPLREGTTPGMVNAVVDVIYKDGTSTNGVTAKMNVTSKIEPGTNVAPAVLSGEEGATSYLVSFEAATVTELAVDTENVELSIKDTSIDVATDNSKTMLNGIVVTATYSDGFVEVVDDWTSKWNAATRANVTGATISYLSGSAEVEFEIERTPEAAPVVDDIAVYYSVNGDEATTTAPTTLYLGDVVTISVWTVDSADEQIADVTSSVTALNGTSFTNSVTAGETAYAATIGYEGYSASVSVVKGTDSIVEDSVSVSYDPEKATTFTAGHPFANSDFKATWETLSGDEFGSVTIALAPTSQSIPSQNAPASVNVQLTLTYSVNGETVTENTVVNVPVYTAD